MAAYAALVSLSKVIDLTLPHERSYIRLCSKEQMMCLHENIRRLQELLEDLSVVSHEQIDKLESRIRDVAYQMEDIIEYSNPGIGHGIPNSLCELFTCLFCMPLLTPSPVAITPSTFDICAGDVSILLEEAMEMKEDTQQNRDASKARHPLTTTTSTSSEAPSVKLNQKKIMDWVLGRVSKLEIVSITGMGGIGKTTLARAVYEHPNTQNHFDICLWVTVSQGYNVKEILRGLLPSSDQQYTVPDEKLIEFVHKRLIGRTFLIVLDDMWDVEAWDGVRNAFQDDNKSSRIILTTRLSGVAEYVGSSTCVHRMQLLSDEQSWDLLREKVGVDKYWSKELQHLGRTISRKCRGLPLAVVAMAGLLKFNMTEEYWNRVAIDTYKSEAASNYDDLFSSLALSYTNLPPHLKSCFLYLGSYEEDSEIPTKDLVRLWMAEGFLKPRGSEEMEDVAEEYLEELVARNLVLVKKKRLDGKIKTCIMHDVLRDLSIRKAHAEKFSQHITRSSSSWMDRYSNNDLRRAITDRYYFPDGLVHHKQIRSIRHNLFEDELMFVITQLRLIRVLSEVHITGKCLQLSILYQLTNLRYLQINICSTPLTVGESISKLQNLETLIFKGGDLVSLGYRDYVLILPCEIWEMPRLRHLILVKESGLPCPPLNEISCSSLQTLHEVTNFDLTRSMIAKLSNLKKLKLYYEALFSRDKSLFSLDNLVHLHYLGELSISSNNLRMKLIGFSFPHMLKKLSLEGTQMPVENMSLIGSLPNLVVLKLKAYGVSGEEWEPVEGEFIKLKYLLMERLHFKEWRAESVHFPQLETLIISWCPHLKEVPMEIGEIYTLQKLLLDDCWAAEESVKEIGAEQKSLGNDLLQVMITRTRNWLRR